MFCACCFVIVVSYCCCVVSLPTLHPPPPPPHSDPPNLVYPVITVMASPSLLPSSSPPSPPLPFVHPLTSIFLSSVCVCPFCDVIPEDTDSPSWTNSGLSLLLLDLLSFLTQPPLLLLLLSFHTSSWLALPHPPPLISIVFSFPASLAFSGAVCALCSVEDASGVFVISHSFYFAADRLCTLTIHRSMVMPLRFLCRRS